MLAQGCLTDAGIHKAVVLAAGIHRHAPGCPYDNTSSRTRTTEAVTAGTHEAAAADANAAYAT